MPTHLAPGVFVEEVDSGSRPIEGVGTAVAAFVGIADKGPCNRPTLISNWKQFGSLFGGFGADSYLAHAVYGYFLNGGGNCYVVRIGNEGQLEPAKAQLNATGDDQRPVAKYEVQALEAGVGAAGLSVEIANEAPPESDQESIKIVVKQGGAVVEEFGDLTTGKSKNVVTAVNRRSKLIKLIEVANVTATGLLTGEFELRSDPLPAAQPLVSADYVGDSASRTGFGGLETVNDVTMVCVPDVMYAFEKGWLDAEGVRAVQHSMIAHCELMGNRVAILDPPPEMSPQGILDWRMNVAGYDSKFAALYWPWVKVSDPVKDANVFVPPSGHMAGIWGRNDDTRGVHKAPANEVVRGAISLASELTSKEQELLNPEGINCIRSFPGRGVRVWGARTISSDPGWRYLNVRRFFNYLEESILNGTQWVVFEPNDDALWARMRRTISAFLVNEWRKGALFGLTPDEGFYVKCDRETNPPEGIDAGEVVCEIGVAPVKPAEFVVFRLSQFSGGAAVADLT